MRDLIDRQAAIEVINAVFPVDTMKSEYAQGITCGAALAKTYVEQLPSAQPERKKGKWIWRTNDIYRCSECETDSHVAECMEEPIYNFCPYCGADMRGDHDE